MEKKTLVKANEISEKLKYCKENLKDVEYTQLENVVIRESHLRFNGIDNGVDVPESLFRVIGKLIKAEYINMITDLEKEFKEL